MLTLIWQQKQTSPAVAVKTESSDKEGRNHEEERKEDARPRRYVLLLGMDIFTTSCCYLYFCLNLLFDRTCNGSLSLFLISGLLNSILY